MGTLKLRTIFCVFFYDDFVPLRRRLLGQVKDIQSMRSSEATNDCANDCEDKSPGFTAIKGQRANAFISDPLCDPLEC